MVELLAAGQGKPVVIIRWNPDDFAIGGQLQTVSEYRRLSTLRKTLASIINTVPTKLIDIHYMFYDDDRTQQLQIALQKAMSAYEAAGV